MVKRRGNVGAAENERESERTKGTEALFSAPFVNVVNRASFQNITMMVKVIPLIQYYLFLFARFFPLNSLRSIILFS